MKLTAAQKAAIRAHYSHWTLRFMKDGTVMARKHPDGAWGMLYSPEQTASHLATLNPKGKRA